MIKEYHKEAVYMSQRAVLWCRSEMGNTEDLTRQNQVLSFYCKEQGMKAVRTIIEYGKADILKLRNFRQMARYDECDVILVENFDVLDFSPDVTTEEIKYLNERGVRIVSVDEGEITPDMLPDLYRKRFKIIVCNRNIYNRRRKIRYN